MNILLIFADTANGVCAINCEHWIDLGISTFGSGITMFIAYLWKFRRLFDNSMFSNQKAAEKHIIKDMENSKELRVFAMCASTFSNSATNEIAKKAHSDSSLQQFYLISDVDNSENIDERQKELPKDADPLITKIENSINNFKSKKTTNPNLKIRTHKKKVGLRLIILDDCLYLSHQEPNKYGKNSKVEKYTKDKPEYRNYLNYFNDLWKQYESSEI